MYHKHGVKLTKAQAQSLAKGQTIRLSHGSLHGPHEVHLTKTQLKKMQRSHANRVGTEIKLSGAQLRHNYKHGAGFLDMLKTAATGAAKALAPMAIDYAGNYVKNTIAPRAINAASNFAKSKVSGMGVRSRKQKGEGLFDFLSHIPVIGNAAADVANGVGNFAVNNAVPLAIMAATDGAAAPIALPMLRGSGVRRTKKGKGLFTNLVKAGAKALAPIAVDAAGSFIKNKVAGSGVRSKRSKRQSGGSFIPTGY